MNWQSEYRSKLATAESAVRQTVKSGNRIFLTGNCSIPKTLLKALVEYVPNVQNVEICHALTVGPSEYTNPALAGHLRSNALFIGANVRKAVWEGRADFTPILLSEMTGLFEKGILPLDIAFIHLSPPDEEGYCTHGIETGITKTSAEAAKIIIAQVNPKMPKVFGDSKIHVSEIDYIVEVEDDLYEHRMSEDPTNPVVEDIADHVAELIPDGATIQTGIGAIPDAVLRRMVDKKDLGIHTELFSDGLWSLVEKGVITNARKTINKGKAIAGLVLGTRDLYNKINENPAVEMRRQEYINDPFVVAQNFRQVAINSALEIDLTGQVCADSIGHKLFSGVGGQLDFIYGASRSEGGVPIIALPSTALSGKRSRIRASLRKGAGVTTTRNHVHWVVTEYGAVNLYGKSVRERSKALIKLAHPKFREELVQTAKKLNYI